MRYGSGNIGRIRVGHGLDYDRRAAADLVLANLDANRFPPRDGKNLHRAFLCQSLIITALHERSKPGSPGINEEKFDYPPSISNIINGMHPI